MKRFQDSLKLGLWVLVTVVIVNYVLSMAGFQVVQLFAVQDYPGVTGISGTIASKMINFVNGLGIVNIDPLSLLYLYISAVAIVFVGSFAYETLKFPRTSKAWTRLAVILLWGTAIFYLLFVGAVMKAWSVWIGLAVYYGLVALTLPFVQKVIRLDL